MTTNSTPNQVEANTHPEKQGKTKDITTTTTASSSDSESSVDTDTLPALHFSFRWSSVLAYIVFLIVCNVLIPCLLFYLLRNFTSMTTRGAIGISSAALGLSSCFDAPFRVYRLIRYRRFYGPLGSDVWWHLDFVMWTYTFALFVFAFPLAIAPAIAFYDFFLMSTMMLVAPVGLVFFLSLLAPKLPFRVSSEPIGAVMKPAVFYTIEDVAAVDFKHGREFRRAMHDRYRVSPPFRRLMKHLTIYWTLSSLVYSGVTAAVTWGSPLQFAFGWVLGQLFLWIGVSTAGSVFLAKRGLREERNWWEEERRGQRPRSATVNEEKGRETRIEA